MTKRFAAITLEDVATFPRPGTAVPGQLGFTPDGSRVTYLKSAAGSLVRSLFALDRLTGEETILAEAPSGSGDERSLSREEQLRRERARLRETGITAYEFAEAADPTVLLVPVGGKLFVSVGGGELRPLDGTDGALDPKLSRDGSGVAFVTDDDLFVAATDGSGVTRLTDDAGDGLTNGVAEFIAHEELGRGEGFWWSPDGSRIAFARADERHVEEFPIVHQGTPEPDVEVHRYPFAGKPNAVVTLGVVEACGGDVAWMDLGPETDVYLARVTWRPDGRVMALVLDRDQRRMRWLACDPETGASEVFLEESGEPWLNLSDDTRFLESGETLFSSERTGFRHLYLVPADGGEPRALTSGEWMVTALKDLDEERRVAFFIGTREGVTERHVYSVSLDGGGIARLTSEPGWHQATFAPDHRSFVDVHSGLEHGSRVTLRDLEGGEVAVLHEDAEANADSLGLVPPTLTTLTADDGTTLHAAVYLPPERAGGELAPLIVSVYGGPHAQRVANDWLLTIDLRAQYLARRGFVVLKVDNRGSANRGLAFEGALSRRFGTVEVADQLAGVRRTVEEYGVDPERVGVFGWSYGGYMTLMCMLRHPDVFAVGVSGAPVTDWDGYDTGYTERYMGTPAGNADGYREGSVLTHAEKLAGKLLLVHGMVDENVHFRHTARLLVALGSATKDYDLLALPEERHMPRDKAGLLDLETRICGFLERNLA
ncbi:MAG: DPP IV N-terminal domain-containing protein [Planctomycetota bacterium]